MVKITINGLNVKLSGHAGYDEFDKDIVCASLSTAFIMTVNQIEVFEMLDCIEYTCKEGLLEIKAINSNDTVSKVIENFINTLKQLEKQYPKYVNIKEN